MSRILLCVLIICAFAGCSDDDEPVTFKPDPATVYFLVAETTPGRGDSFIIGLTDENEIEAARDIIETGQSKIVFAEISPITDRSRQGNFDLQNNKRRWSWYVSKFVEFTDVTAEIYDGYPTYVEEHYDEFVATTKGDNGKGRIGFWTYTVSREVSHDELEGL
jgi:hypothetical protein